MVFHSKLKLKISDIAIIRRRATKLENENKVLEKEYNDTVAKWQRAKKAKLTKKVEILEETRKEWKEKIESLKKKIDIDDDSYWACSHCWVKATKI